MASNMRISRAGLDVIKAFEGFRPRYQKLPDGRWIVGYGHVREERETVEITLEEAETLLREYDLPSIERLVMDCVLAPLNQNEFDALVSLAYSLGAKAFAGSDVVANINSGNRLAAAQAFDQWCRARIGGRVQMIDALVRRRATEKALFLRAPGATPAASSRIYIPMAKKLSLPPPQKPREILVERAPLSQDEAEPDEAASIRTATEDAAESVRRRLVRILGEDGNGATSPAGTTDGASPEEITAAISALAGDQPAPGERVEKSVWPAREDLPPPFLDDAEENADAADTTSTTIDRIDDLAEPEISPDEIKRAVEVNNAIEARENGSVALGALPFALLSLVGLGLAIYGAALRFGFWSDVAPTGNGLALYLPPFLLLLGVLLFVVMAYYFVRALAGHND